MREKVCIVSGEISTALGSSPDECFDALMHGRSGIREIERFSMPRTKKHSGVTMKKLDGMPPEKITDKLLETLLPHTKKLTPDTNLFLACTVGDIEHLYNKENTCTAELMLKAALKKFSFQKGRIISAACASSNTAIDRASKMIAQGLLDSAFVMSADHVSEFLCSGFTALKAMSNSIVRPYDTQRDGLILGDAAGCVTLTTEKYAHEHELAIKGTIEGSALGCDAFHITAPIPNGERLVETIGKALAHASLTPDDIGCVIGHGTGTRLNDAMEAEVMGRIFRAGTPLISVKGTFGHTLAGSGVLQTAIALKIIEKNIIPPQNFLNEPIPEALPFLSDSPRTLEKKHILLMNSGFGGVNAVVIIGRR